jgi:hypothetical protein
MGYKISIDGFVLQYPTMTRIRKMISGEYGC